MHKVISEYLRSVNFKGGHCSIISGEDTVDVTGMFDAEAAGASDSAAAAGMESSCNPKFPRTCVRP